MPNLSVGVAGVSGHMGTMVVRQIIETDGVRVGAGSVRPGSSLEGFDIGSICKTDPINVTTSSSALELFENTAAVIDFTLPETIENHAKAAVMAETPWIVGTTGLDGNEEATLREVARSAPVVFAPNMSLGVNLLFVLIEQVARALDDNFDIEIFEIHHNRKIDAPSGTALGLGRAAARGRGVDLDSTKILSREGQTGTRQKGKIGFAALRGGDIVGDHSVIFAGAGERVEITHKAAGRHIYAAGAIRAAQWAVSRDPGLYDMTDVLGLKS